MQGKSSTCVLVHRGQTIVLVMRGDGFTAPGRDVDLYWCRGVIHSKLSTNAKGRLGPGKEDMHQLGALNRVVDGQIPEGV